MAEKKKKAKKAKSTEIQVPKLKKVLIATPAYNGQVNIGYMRSVINVILQGPSHGYEINLFTNTDSLITRARNNAVATFLDGNWDRLFWIDADITFEPEQFFRVLDIDRDIAAAAYPLKAFSWPAQPTNLTGRALEAFMLRYALGLDGDIDNIPKDGFVPVREAATGFMCINRATIEMMIGMLPDIQYKSDQELLGAPSSQNHYLLFDTLVVDSRYLSEDYAFCHRAKDCGVSIWLDINSQLTHTGPFDFRGSIPETNRAATIG